MCRSPLSRRGRHGAISLPAAVTPWQDGDGGRARVRQLSVTTWSPKVLGVGANRLVHVQREQQPAVQLERTADQVTGLPLERVRRTLEVAGVDIYDVRDRVD